ncbi:MAG: hypothetical protein EKE20_02570 [Candidatus Symbiopectobacterium sp. Dall1.0]|nr:hypothetical protein [Candidatus Symbiopectobacterium sp. Dall1.0]
MIYIIKSITLLLCIFVGASLLKGAGVGFDSWYAAPEALSQGLVTVLTLFFLAKIALFVISVFFEKE